MIFDPPLTEGVLLRRYQRFLADVRLDGAAGPVTVHCPNPGAMMGVAPAGARCWASPAANPKRKLRWTLEIVEADGACVGVNTQTPNRLVEEALAGDAIAELRGYARRRREVRHGAASRIDFVLQDDARPPAYVEVKNVHLRRTAALAEFPDCVTTRGAKHLQELAAMARQGARAVQLFIVQRTDCASVALAADLDPGYAAAFEEAVAAGVEPLAYACAVSPHGIEITRRIPVEPAANASR